MRDDHDLLEHVDLTAATMGLNDTVFQSLQAFVTTLVVPSGRTCLILLFPNLQIYCVYPPWGDALMPDDEAIECTERHILDDRDLTLALRRVNVCRVNGYSVKE